MRNHRNGTSPARPPDAGSSTVELVITMPALLLAVLAIIQIGLWFHTRHVALAAAQDGLRIARAYDGTTAAARQRAVADLDHLAPTLLNNRTVDVSRGTDTATVTVRGRETSILGVFHLSVQEHAQGPIEKFVPITAAGRR